MGDHILPDHNGQILMCVLLERLSCFRLMLLRPTEQKKKKKKSSNGIRHLLRLPKLKKKMMMKCQVITYQGVLMLSYANHYNPDLSFDVV